MQQNSKGSLLLESSSLMQFESSTAVTTNLSPGVLCRIYGTYATIDEKNENGRTYEFDNYFSQVQSMLPKVAAKRLLGEMEHVKRRTIKYPNVSHRIDSIEWVAARKSFEGWISILDTPAGRIAYAIIMAGSPLYISSRAIGVVNKQTGKVTLLKLITFDLVAEPGFYNAEFSMDSTKKLLGQHAQVNSMHMRFVNESLDEETFESAWSDMSNEDRKALLLAHGFTQTEAILLMRTPFKQLTESELTKLTKLFVDLNIITEAAAVFANESNQADYDAAKKYWTDASTNDRVSIINALNASSILTTYDVAMANKTWGDIPTIEQTQLRWYIVDNILQNITESNMNNEKLIKSLVDAYNTDNTGDAAKIADIVKFEDLLLKLDSEIDFSDEAIISTLALANEDDLKEACKLLGVEFVSEAFNVEYINTCWNALDAETKIEVLTAAGIKKPDDFVELQTLEEVEDKQAIIDAMVAAGYAKEDMVNIDESKKPRARYKFVNESADALDWDAASPIQRVSLLGAGGFNDDEIGKYKDSQLSDMPADIAKRVLDACQAWVVESIKVGDTVTFAKDFVWQSNGDTMGYKAGDKAKVIAIENDGDIIVIDSGTFGDRIAASYFVNESDESSTWWYSASEADRQQVIDNAKLTISSADAVKSSWEMFDNESKNALEAAIKIQCAAKIDEGYDANNNKYLDVVDVDKAPWAIGTKIKKGDDISVTVKSKNDDGSVYIIVTGNGTSEELNLDIEDVKRFINESIEPEQKDIDRMTSIISKSGGDENKQLMYVTNMAKAITNAAKAKRRALAAKAAGLKDNLVSIFDSRATELGFVNESVSITETESLIAAAWDKMDVTSRVELVQQIDTVVDTNLAYESLSKLEQLAVGLAMAGQVNESEDDDLTNAQVAWKFNDEEGRKQILDVIGEKDMTYTGVDNYNDLPDNIKSAIEAAVETEDAGIMSLIDKATSTVKKFADDTKKRLDNFTSESAEAWDASTIDKRKEWLLAKEYTLSNSEYYAAQDFATLTPETQSFVAAYFVNESADDAYVVVRYDSRRGTTNISAEGLTKEQADEKAKQLTKDAISNAISYKVKKASDVNEAFDRDKVSRSIESAMNKLKDATKYAEVASIIGNQPIGTTVAMALSKASDAQLEQIAELLDIDVKNVDEDSKWLKVYAETKQGDSKTMTIPAGDWKVGDYFEKPAGTKWYIKEIVGSVDEAVESFEAKTNMSFTADYKGPNTGSAKVKAGDKVEFDKSSTKEINGMQFYKVTNIKTEDGDVVYIGQKTADKAMNVDEARGEIATKVYDNLTNQLKDVIDTYFKEADIDSILKDLKTMPDNDMIARIIQILVKSATLEARQIINSQTALIVQYIAAYCQDNLVDEGLLKFKYVKPRKARFVNESAEETKPTAEDVDTIIDGLVDATAINAQQADELRDAVADSADLDKLSTKAELAEQIAEVADDLGIDVDLDDCLSMVNESAAGDDVVDALLKDKTAADFDITTVEIDGRTSTAIVTKDGQLTGIELEGEATETTVAELQSLLNKYLAAVNTDESLTMFKKAFKRINVDEAKLPSMFDTAGFVIAAPAAQQIDCIGNPPAAYKVIVESLTDDQVDLLKRQAGIREFVNESDVLSFYRSRNWSQIKQYSKSGKVGFVNEASIAATGFTPEQLDLIRAIKG